MWAAFNLYQNWPLFQLFMLQQEGQGQSSSWYRGWSLCTSAHGYNTVSCHLRQAFSLATIIFQTHFLILPSRLLDLWVIAILIGWLWWYSRTKSFIWWLWSLIIFRWLEMSRFKPKRFSMPVELQFLRHKEEIYDVSTFLGESLRWKVRHQCLSC